MNKLKELREKNNFTILELAKMLGISKSYYCKLENKKATLTYEMSIKIARIFELKPDDIFFDDYIQK